MLPSDVLTRQVVFASQAFSKAQGKATNPPELACRAEITPEDAMAYANYHANLVAQGFMDRTNLQDHAFSLLALTGKPEYHPVIIERKLEMAAVLCALAHPPDAPLVWMLVGALANLALTTPHIFWNTPCMNLIEAVAENLQPDSKLASHSFRLICAASERAPSLVLHSQKTMAVLIEALKNEARMKVAALSLARICRNHKHALQLVQHTRFCAGIDGASPPVRAQMLRLLVNVARHPRAARALVVWGIMDTLMAAVVETKDARTPAVEVLRLICEASPSAPLDLPVVFAALDADADLTGPIWAMLWSTTRSEPGIGRIAPFHVRICTALMSARKDDALLRVVCDVLISVVTTRTELMNPCFDLVSDIWVSDAAPDIKERMCAVMGPHVLPIVPI